MKGLMQHWPMRVYTILDHAAANHATQEVVTRTLEGDIHRITYENIHLRARQGAQALARLGIKEGDVCATLAWNTWRHLEAWYAITGLGAVYHTLNPRLFTEQLIYIINHAEDKYIFTDTTFVPLLEQLESKLPKVKGFIIMAAKKDMPATSLKNVLGYEDLLSQEDGNFSWATVDEDAACGLCYTSGTTGNPKGVLYSHRSNVLHTLFSNQPDAIGLASADTVMPVVPMFHANAWGISFSAPLSGSKIVMPGKDLDGESVYQLLSEEKVTVTAAVPTVWLGLLQYLESQNKKLPDLRKVVIGGSAAPRSMIETFERKYDVEVMHAWGMTEMSPLGTLGSLKSHMHMLDHDKKLDIKCKQGRLVYMVEAKITDDDGKTLPRDGETFGHLMVRGPAVASSYFKDEGGNILDKEGWFDTGDIATLDSDGYIQITDRSKDVIKSGGEWISSIEIENLAVGHPEIAEAAVIGIVHPKWDERPLLILVRKEGSSIEKDEILHFMKGKIAKWWMPDDVTFVEEIPHTATGKIQKRDLREQFKDYTLPTEKTAG